MAQGEFKAAVFDHDDTLKVTRRVVYGQMVELGSQYGLTIDKDLLDESWGLGWEDQLQFVYGDVATVAELTEAYEALSPKFPSRANKDSVDVLAVLKHAKIVRGIVSSHNGRMVRNELVEMGIGTEEFAFIHGSEDTNGFHKPEPEVFDPAAEYLEKEHGIVREETAYFGDDIRDYKAARDSGWGFVGVTTGIHTREQFEAEGAVAVSCLTDAVGIIFPDAYSSYINIKAIS
jgi:phosphoglycolate phosphatase-like HAD superfamily hydrolase